MAKQRSKPVSKGGSHVREPKASAPHVLTPEALRKARRGGIFSGAHEPRCVCGRTEGVMWVTVNYQESDAEGVARTVFSGNNLCALCRQLGFGLSAPSHAR